MTHETDIAPPAEELEKYYIMLQTDNIPELQWQNPGRRAPSPESGSKSEPNTAVESAEAQEPVTKNDFDFSDDMTQPQIRVRNQNSTPKTAKKRKANFAGVMEVLKKKNAEGST